MSLTQTLDKLTPGQLLVAIVVGITAAPAGMSFIVDRPALIAIKANQDAIRAQGEVLARLVQDFNEVKVDVATGNVRLDEHGRRLNSHEERIHEVENGK